MMQLANLFPPPSQGNDESPGAAETSSGPRHMPKKKRDDFTFDKIIGEGSYSTVSP